MPEKRKRSGEEAGAADVSAAPIKSVMTMEEGAFPRGGGSGVLTPLEVKQAANEAAQDLFSGKSKPKSKKHKSKKEVAPVKKDMLRIETLSFARLVTGSIVVGQVCQVNKLDLAISLPNNLIGYVPITNISSQLSSQLDKLNDDSDEEESDDEADIPKLSEIFKVGQWLRAVVSENAQLDSTKSTKRHIELSIDPQAVNAAIDDEDLDAGMAVQGSIRSIEDHGVIIDLGRANGDVSGFLSNKELSFAELEASSLKIGQVLLLTVLSKSKNGRTLTLSATPLAKKIPVIKRVTALSSIIAGTLVEALVTEVRSSGLITKVLGLIDATVDLVHSGVVDKTELEAKYKEGDKVKARVVFSVPSSFHDDEDKVKVALSLLEPSLALTAPSDSDVLAIGQIVQATVKAVEVMGLYVDVGAPKSLGYVHISRVSDSRIEDLSIEDAYVAGSTHSARVLGYSYADGLYTLSLEPSVIDQKYLRIEDIPVGELITGHVERILPKGSIIIKLWEGVTALTSEMHLSDIKLVHPEKKFKPGMKVTGRVLSVDAERRRVYLTLKKALVNTQDPILKSYSDATTGMRTPGTVISLQPRGAIIEFFGGVKAFLPVSEISEAFISDPKEHFRLGQSVSVRVITVDVEAKRLLVSCRSSGSDSKTELEQVQIGKVYKATIVEKTKTSVVLSVQPSGIRGVLAAQHMTDAQDTKAQLKKAKVNDEIDVVVLEKHSAKRFVTLSTKPSLLQAARDDKLPSQLSDVHIGDKLHGFVRGVTMKGVFVGFAGQLSGLAMKAELSEEFISDPSEKFSPFQSVECRVISIDDSQARFLLSFKAEKGSQQVESSDKSFNPVDPSVKSAKEFTPGKVTKAQITGIKDTQLNVRLADNVQGRIDVSVLFDDASSIKDLKNPLGQFEKGQELDVKLIGYHDARNHRFLAISHRGSSHLVHELSAKHIDSDYTALDVKKDVPVGSKWVAFINNITVDFVWVSLSPTVRARISLLDLTDNVDELEDIEAHYPIGSAVECTVIESDAKSGSIKMSARENTGTAISKFEDVEVGQKLPGVVLKVGDNFILLKLGNDVVASAQITDCLDDFSEDLKSSFLPHQLVKTQVVEVDSSNKKIYVSLRQSVVGNTEAVDRVIDSSADLSKGDVVRGFVRHVSDSGVFVSLSRAVSGRVQIKNLSDSFLKDWKNFFTVGQVVTSKVLSVAKDGKVELSLKESIVTGKKNETPSGLSALTEGEIVDGVITKVESFGVFVRLTDSKVSGLCHKSEVADVPLQDLSKVFSEGDKVKAKILKIDAAKNRLSLGLKASYFAEEGDSDIEMDIDDEDMDDLEDDDEVEEEEDSEQEIAFGSDSEEEDSEEEVPQVKKAKGDSGLSVGFDWTANILDQTRQTGWDDEDDESEGEDKEKTRKRRKKQILVEDKTGSLNTKLPQSVGDFERLVIGSPNSSLLWMNYMAFQLQLSEIDKAREIGQRALKAINYREEQERFNIWIALLNLENNFGTEQTVEDVFKEATQYMDSRTVHMKLAGIYAATPEKVSKAESLYDTTMKKFGSEDVSIWLVYAQFLFEQDNATKARSLLNRALKSLPQRNHKEVLTKFAQLEYSKGDIEVGRTLFEGLVSSYPRRIDLWIVYIDYEIKKGGRESVEKLFERVVEKVKLSMKQAKYFFKKWLSYEDTHGDSKASDYVKAKAAEYVTSRQEDEE